MTARHRVAAKTVRILDANLNRANEAARVVEDYARFVLDHAGLANAAKSIRHRIQTAAASAGLKTRALLAARDTAGDVGTELVGAHETKRPDASALLRANFQRLEQALRVLEEYSKLLRKSDPGFEAIRYDTYTLEKDFAAPPPRPARLDDKRLMVIVGTFHTTSGKARDVVTLARAVLAGGCRLVELREKEMPDWEYLALARALRGETRKRGALLILNDRADIAKLSQADGVHLGLDDLPIADARRILGPSKLIGLTAHSADDVRRAEAAGADYIGVGTMFRSHVKPSLPAGGPRKLLPAILKCDVPCYAIGGIDRRNIGGLLKSGITRAAIGWAITSAKDVAAETKWFVRRLAGRQGRGSKD